MSSPAFQIGYFVWSLVVFSVVVRATRPPRRRLFGAVIAVVIFTALSAPIDELGARWNLWTYPCFEAPPHHPSVVVYFAQAAIFVGTIALVGWRVQRAFGLRGVVVLTAIVLVLGAVRDFGVGAMLPDVIHFGPQPAALLGDVAAWAVVVLVALVVPRVVSGPAREVVVSR